MVSIATVSVLVGISAGLCCRYQTLALICMLGAMSHFAVSGFDSTAILNAALTMVALQVGYFVSLVIAAIREDADAQRVPVVASSKDREPNGARVSF